MGKLNFYRRLLPRATSIQDSLHDVISTHKYAHTNNWTVRLTAAFDEFKASFWRSAFLAHPDYTAPIALVTDASTNATGAVLLQQVQEVWQSLAFFSRKQSPA
jgi:hypothetical protein